MKSLQEVLNDTRITAEPLDKSNALSSTQVHGLTTEDGKTNTESQNNQSQNQSTSEPRKLSDCPQSQSRLTSLLLICFDTLDTFGREPEQLANLAESFRIILGRFTIQQIEAAFRLYMERQTTMPKPADIVNIIEPPIKPKKWCATTFIDLRRQQREGQFITNAEKKYMQDFLAAQVKEPDNAEMISKAVKEAEMQDKRYWLEP